MTSRATWEWSVARSRRWTGEPATEVPALLSDGKPSLLWSMETACWRGYLMDFIGFQNSCVSHIVIGNENLTIYNSDIRSTHICFVFIWSLNLCCNDDKGPSIDHGSAYIRSCILILLATALGGIWSLEQPGGAITEYYPAFRLTLQHIFECGGPTAVRAWIFEKVYNTSTHPTQMYWKFKILIACLVLPPCVITGAVRQVVDGSLQGRDTQKALCLQQLHSHPQA